MRRRHALYVGVAVVVLLPLIGALELNAGAQTNGGYAGVGLPADSGSFGVPWSGAELTEVLLSEGLVGLLGIIGCGLLLAGLEALDAWRDRRADEVAAVLGRIANALHRNWLLNHLNVTAVIYHPPWGRSGATVELRGHVPTAWLRAAVRRTAELESARHLADYHIEDRIVIAPSREAEAA
jgi:hypothetical protein